MPTTSRKLDKHVESLTNKTAALSEANEELRKINRMKDQFLAMLSHELRTPLTSMLGWVSMLQSGKLDAEKTAHGLKVIERNVRAQMQLIDDLLNASNSISGKLKINPDWIDLASLIQMAADSVEPAAEAKGIDLDVDVDASLSLVYADAARMQEVVWNLLTNAIKFTPRGGRITIRLKSTDCGIEVSVSDTGEGIDGAFMPYIFDRFTQADSSSTRRHGGLGLGLAIVRQIAELHGGWATVESEGRGKGAIFTVCLPAPPNVI